VCSSDLGGYLAGVSSAAQKVVDAYARQKRELDGILPSLQRQEVTLQDIERAQIMLNHAASDTGRTMNVLGREDLATLRDAIDQARRRMMELRQEASDTLSSIQDEWDQLNNNLDEIEARRAQKREAELQAQLAAAKAAGDKQAIADLQKALDLLRQVNSELIHNAQLQEQQNKTNGTSSSSSTGGTVSGGGGISYGAPTYNITIPVISSNLDDAARTLFPYLQKLTQLRS
jgi:chromosome segregation ATPase